MPPTPTTTVVVVRNDFDRLALMLRHEAEQIVADTANDIEERMKATAGNRIAGTVSSRGSNGGLTATVTAGDLRMAIHAGFVEYGTVGQSAKPFATPSAEAFRSSFMAGMRNLLRRGF